MNLYVWIVINNDDNRISTVCGSEETAKRLTKGLEDHFRIEEKMIE